MREAAKARGVGPRSVARSTTATTSWPSWTLTRPTVASTVPADSLLEFDVAEGWAPLCAFLGVPEPDEPFPRTNSTEEFRTRSGLDL